MESYEFELWAQLPDDDNHGIAADEVADEISLDLDPDQVAQVLSVLKESGLETSISLVEERLPQLHATLWQAAELLAKKYMALRLFVHNCYEVDDEDLFEADLRDDRYTYQRPDDVDGGLDDEEGYADALCDWQQWESSRIMDMPPADCVDYLAQRYGIHPAMDDVDFGYRLPDELAAQAMADWC